MVSVRAHFGTGLPVDLESLLSSAAPGVDWVPHDEHHQGHSGLAVNELVAAIAAEFPGGWSNAGVALRGPDGETFSAWFNLSDFGGWAMLSGFGRDCYQQFDEFAACADQLELAC